MLKNRVERIGSINAITPVKTVQHFDTLLDRRKQNDKRSRETLNKKEERKDKWRKIFESQIDHTI